MKTVSSRFAAVIAVTLLIFGAAACAPTDDDHTGSTPSSGNDTASEPSSEDQADVAAAQRIDEVDLSQPPPDDLSFEDEKTEKNYDCCVFKDGDNVDHVCGCVQVSGNAASTWFQCRALGTTTKRGSGCGAYTDCQRAIEEHGNYCAP